jgi:hypothetical protein
MWPSTADRAGGNRKARGGGSGRGNAVDRQQLAHLRRGGGWRPGNTFSDATGRKGSTRPPGTERVPLVDGPPKRPDGCLGGDRGRPRPEAPPGRFLGLQAQRCGVRRGLKLPRRAGHYLPSRHDLPGGHDLAKWSQVGRGQFLPCREVPFPRGQELSEV